MGGVTAKARLIYGGALYGGGHGMWGGHGSKVPSSKPSINNSVTKFHNHNHFSKSFIWNSQFTTCKTNSVIFSQNFWKFSKTISKTMSIYFFSFCQQTSKSVYVRCLDFDWVFQCPVTTLVPCPIVFIPGMIAYLFVEVGTIRDRKVPTGPKDIVITVQVNDISKTGCVRCCCISPFLQPAPCPSQPARPRPWGPTLCTATPSPKPDPLGKAWCWPISWFSRFFLLAPKAPAG